TFGQVTEPSRPHEAPLVSQAAYEPYQTRQGEIAAKQREITRTTEQAVESYRGNLRPQLAAYLIAAWRVVRGGSIESPAGPARLDTAPLKRWAAYFQAAGPEAGQRPYLDEWRQATAENIERVATVYSDRYDAAERRWRDQRAASDKQLEAALARGLTPR